MAAIDPREVKSKGFNDRNLAFPCCSGDMIDRDLHEETLIPFWSIFRTDDRS